MRSLRPIHCMGLPFCVSIYPYISFTNTPRWFLCNLSLSILLHDSSEIVHNDNFWSQLTPSFHTATIFSNTTHQRELQPLSIYPLTPKLLGRFNHFYSSSLTLKNGNNIEHFQATSSNRDHLQSILATFHHFSTCDTSSPPSHNGLYARGLYIPQTPHSRPSHRQPGANPAIMV